MKNTKKSLSAVCAAVLMLGCSMAGTACGGGGGGTSKDSKTINVKLFEAGFGSVFLYDLKKEFEKVYAEEEYKVNILDPDYGNSGEAMVQEMSRGYDATNVDLYITAAIQPNAVSKAGTYGEVCEDIEALVFNQTAINYDGTESENKISERIMSDFVPFLRADDGTMYGFNWAQSTAGMVVNTTKLETYGITELPRTTNEMFEIFDIVLNGTEVDGKTIEGSEKTKTYPITFAMSTGYQNCVFNTWFAQYGVDSYNEFYNMQTKTEDGWVDMENAYKVYENEALKEILEVGYQMMDIKYAAKNSSTQKLDQAQGLIMRSHTKKTNNAIFMPNGDWFLNEVKANFSANLGDIDFMNFPVISELGIKLFGSGTAYNLSDEECDDLLSYLCKLVDENKSLEEIKTLAKVAKNVTLEDADVEAVAEARGVCYTRGIEHLAFITKGSTKADIAALFLRMMASDDFAETFMNKANGSSPYTPDVQGATEYKFINSAKALVANSHFRAISGTSSATRLSVLTTTNMFPTSVSSNLAMTMYQRSSNKSYETAAQELFNNAQTEVTKLWNTYISKK